MQICAYDWVFGTHVSVVVASSVQTDWITFGWIILIFNVTRTATFCHFDWELRRGERERQFNGEPWSISDHIPAEVNAHFVGVSKTLFLRNIQLLPHVHSLSALSSPSPSSSSLTVLWHNFHIHKLSHEQTKQIFVFLCFCCCFYQNRLSQMQMLFYG